MKRLYGFLVFFLFVALNLSAQQNEKPNPDVKEIIFVFKTHFDNGYTDMAESVINKYSTTMMDQALNTLEKSRSLPREKQFVWTMPAWPLTKILERCSPEMKPKIEAAIREGWFVYHGLPFTLETEAGDPEALVRALTFASDFVKEIQSSFTPRCETDGCSESFMVPSHSAHQCRDKDTSYRMQCSVQFSRCAAPVLVAGTRRIEADDYLLGKRLWYKPGPY